MSNETFEVLHYESVVDDTGGSDTTAEVLRIVNGEPKEIFVVPVHGMKLPTEEQDHER